MKIVWSPLALRRANEIADYIAADNPAAARQWLLDLFGAVKRLENFPRSGRVVPEAKRENIREIFHGKYRVIYRVKAKSVAILTVRHGRQQLPLQEITGKK